MVDAVDSKSTAERRASSSLASGTINTELRTAAPLVAPFPCNPLDSALTGPNPPDSGKSAAIRRDLCSNRNDPFLPQSRHSFYFRAGQLGPLSQAAQQFANEKTGLAGAASAVLNKSKKILPCKQITKIIFRKISGNNTPLSAPVISGSPQQ